MFCKANGLDNVIFIDSVSRTEVIQYWSLFNVAVIHLRKTPLFRSVIPSKLFECMAMGVPMLLGLKGGSAEIVRREDIGVCFEPENSDDFVKSLINIRDDKLKHKRCQKNAIKTARKYNRKLLAYKMLNLIKQATRNNSNRYL